VYLAFKDRFANLNEPRVLELQNLRNASVMRTKKKDKDVPAGVVDKPELDAFEMADNLACVVGGCGCVNTTVTTSRMAA
jgi:hypothetical protein